MAKRQTPQPAAPAPETRPPPAVPPAADPTAPRTRTRRPPQMGAGVAGGDVSGRGSSDEQIARRAYEIYERRGGEHGRHEDDWFQAERELRGAGPSDGGAATPPSTRGRPSSKPTGGL